MNIEEKYTMKDTIEYYEMVLKNLEVTRDIATDVTSIANIDFSILSTKRAIHALTFMSDMVQEDNE